MRRWKRRKPRQQSYHQNFRFHQLHVSLGYAIPLSTSFVLLSTAFRFSLFGFSGFLAQLPYLGFSVLRWKRTEHSIMGGMLQVFCLMLLFVFFTRTFLFSASNHDFLDIVPCALCNGCIKLRPVRFFLKPIFLQFLWVCVWDKNWGFYPQAATYFDTTKERRTYKKRFKRALPR